jgi:hypothetical protein
MSSIVFSVRGLVRDGHWISVEWHWGCGVASRLRASLPAGGGPPLLVTAVLHRRWFPVFPSFFFASFSLRFGSD